MKNYRATFIVKNADGVYLGETAGPARDIPHAVELASKALLARYGGDFEAAVEVVELKGSVQEVPVQH